MLVHEDYGVEVKRILGERNIPSFLSAHSTSAIKKTANTNISGWSRKDKKIRAYKKPDCFELFDLRSNMWLDL